MRRQLIETSVTLAVAEVAKQTGVSVTSGLSPTQVENFVNIVDSAVTPKSQSDILMRDFSGSTTAQRTIRTSDRRSSESLGIRIDLALSTNAALAKIRDGRAYDVIISDMGRPDSEAG